MLVFTATYIAMPLLSLSILLMIVRFIKGPTTTDRIVVLDQITVAGIAFIAVLALITNETRIIDVGLIIALLGFLTTSAFAYYLERRVKDGR